MRVAIQGAVTLEVIQETLVAEALVGAIQGAVTQAGVTLAGVTLADATQVGATLVAGRHVRTCTVGITAQPLLGSTTSSVESDHV